MRVSSSLEQMVSRNYLAQGAQDLSRSRQVMSEQKKVLLGSDNPAAMQKNIRIQSLLHRLNQYSGNIGTLENQLRMSDTYLQKAIDNLQSVHRLAVQAANGTYGEEERKKMALEVNAYLEDIISLSNMKDSSGNSLYGGKKLEGDAFMVLRGSLGQLGGDFVQDVQYIGDARSMMMDIGDQERAAINFAGSEIFWAENQRLESTVNVAGYVANQDEVFVIDGKEITVFKGDGIENILERINTSGAPVKASVDPARNTLVFTSLVPHQMSFEEPSGQENENGFLSSMGILRGNTFSGNAIRADLKVEGGSIFQSIIRLRDEMVSNNRDYVGGEGLAKIQKSIDSLLDRLGSLGALSKRTESMVARMEKEKGDHLEYQNELVGMDLAQALTDYQARDDAYQTILRSLSEMNRYSLWDYLR